MTTPAAIERAVEASIGYANLGMLTDAWDELETLEPDERAHPHVLRQRVYILLSLERWEDALALAEGTFAACGDPELAMLAAVAAHRLKRWQKSREMLTKSPGWGGGSHHYRFACCECQLGDLAAAKEHLAKAFKADPELRAEALQDKDLAPVWDSLATFL